MYTNVTQLNKTAFVLYKKLFEFYVCPRLSLHVVYCYHYIGSE